ncbi:MOSC domain-containing protein [Gracilimonas mengyeensis]|uniref:MOSC domain-containing protein n=1 Tax=Gracilimonas mengyeensis TaxID=1302730 RepID=A0A521BLH2_9BACT|nr:MOSC domain-containing protein [Gracilimonas mengyeensis]SMO47956.1 MOSC domain-containing protein [Gracilimonas mengyeensis]
MITEKEGKVAGIFISRDEGGKITEVEDIEAVAGIGLKGDRYYSKQLSTPEEKRRPKKELTLVEFESVEILNKDGRYGTVQPGDLRRNLVTKGVHLNNLTGQTFFVGKVKVKGIELCEPCRHLEKLTGKKIMKPLVHKAGLRAQILEGGIIKKGDRIVVEKAVI